MINFELIIKSFTGNEGLLNERKIVKIVISHFSFFLFLFLSLSFSLFVLSLTQIQASTCASRFTNLGNLFAAGG